MTHLLFMSIAALIAAAALPPAPAGPRDINRTVQKQSNMQPADEKAAAAAQAFSNYALKLRQMGYTEPYPAGVTPEDVIKREPCNCCCRFKNRDSIHSIYDAIVRGCANVYWDGSRWVCQ
ncbi:MAG: hypothetical protein ABSH09_07255 [Bryobacteraceae bacterium]|jgi:hypothetical protein